MGSIIFSLRLLFIEFSINVPIRVCTLSNLEYRPIYHTRHTFATVMIENNEDILWVSNMLGHVNSTMTLSKYARYIKRANKERAVFLKDIA
ncbi:MAG: tyrosine-type recombinase/integrase [Candidatus Cloacimonadota bacterium]|nr:tyrosine-type recombinase/integrase [Candidatus Cloacimonadota bacterium]